MRGLLAIALLSGCATLFAGNTTTIQVRANPGQPIVIDGAPAGTSPTDVEVSTHEDHVITIGGRSCQVDAEVGVVWIALDIVAGVWPLVVDAITGDWNNIDQATCRM